MVVDDLYEIIKDCLPNDHCRQVEARDVVERLVQDGPRGRRILDFGCGDGRSVDLFRGLDATIEYHGLDIEESTEVAARTRTDATFHTYDGAHFPFEDGSFDLVYSHQVFEHVRRPDVVLAEVARVLRDGGAFVGSVSSLEPYHSRSYWNFTPFGWWTLLRDAGLTPVELRPGIDGVALIRRAYLGRPDEAAAWFRRSPLNEEMDRWGQDTKRRPALVNLRKLQFCGHLVFRAAKQAGG